MKSKLDTNVTTPQADAVQESEGLISMLESIASEGAMIHTLSWTVIAGVCKQAATALAAAQAREGRMREALEGAVQWHQGDKWRDGDSKQRATWESMRDKLQRALDLSTILSAGRKVI